MLLGELDIPVVVHDLDGVAQTPGREARLLDDDLLLEQQLPEPLHRQVLPGAGLGDLHAPVLVVSLLVQLYRQVRGVVPVVAHVQDLPPVLRLPPADPVRHIAVVRHVPGGQGAPAPFRPCPVLNPV